MKHGGELKKKRDNLWFHRGRKEVEQAVERNRKRAQRKQKAQDRIVFDAVKVGH